MKTRRLPRLLLLIGLVGLATFLVGGGNDCPKPCTIEGAACAPECGADPNGTCSPTLVCTGGGDPDAPSEPAESEEPQE